MTKATTTLKVIEIPVTELVPNPWNVNRMAEEIQVKLAAAIKQDGLVEPIVVRKHGDGYQILGGEHRWRICKDRLGYKTLPCAVLDLDDKRAKVLSVNLNEMSGQPVPALLADLLHDLSKEISLEDLETLLPYRKSEIEDALDLLKLPAGLDLMLEEAARKEEEEAPVVVSIVLTKPQNEIFEAALTKALQESGESKNRRGRAVELMARAYLKAVPEAVQAAGAK